MILRWLSRIAWVLVLAGAIDEGLYGIFQFHMAEVLLGAKFIARLFFILVGLSAAFLIYNTTRKSA